MTSEEEEKQDSEAELEGAGKAIWLSCSVDDNTIDHGCP